MDNKVRPADDKEHRYCNVEGWAVLTVPLGASFFGFFLSCFVLAISFNGSRDGDATCRNDDAQNPSTQGDVREFIKYAFILQTIVLLKLTMCFDYVCCYS